MCNGIKVSVVKHFLANNRYTTTRITLKHGVIMHSNSQSRTQPNAAIPLMDYEKLQIRYQSLNLAERAAAVLTDAQPALGIAEDILHKLATNNAIKQVFIKIRKNSLIAGKMRPSDARDLMLDGSSDFIAGTIHKLAAWRKTMERLCQGEGIISLDGRETIPANCPIALAIGGTACVSNYLSIIQLALSEQMKTDKKNAVTLRTQISEIRRCATILSDCENAAGITALVH